MRWSEPVYNRILELRNQISKRDDNMRRDMTVTFDALLTCLQEEKAEQITKYKTKYNLTTSQMLDKIKKYQQYISGEVVPIPEKVDARVYGGGIRPPHLMSRADWERELKPY